MSIDFDKPGVVVAVVDDDFRIPATTDLLSFGARVAKLSIRPLFSCSDRKLSHPPLFYFLLSAFGLFDPALFLKGSDLFFLAGEWDRLLSSNE